MKMCDIWAITPALNFLVTKAVIRRHENEKVANVLRIERGRGVDVVELELRNWVVPGGEEFRNLQ